MLEVNNERINESSSKKKKIILFSSIGAAVLVVVAIVLIILLSGGGNDYQSYVFTVGNGTKDSPYELSTKEDLVGLQQDVLNNVLHYQEYFVLKSNINLEGMIWTPIGTQNRPFTGHIDGKGFTISNFKIENATDNCVGLFASIWLNDIDSNVAVKNLNITNAEVVVKDFLDNSQNIGVLVGNCGGKIENCNVSGKISISNSKFNGVGIVAGYCTGDISNCVADGQLIINNPEYNIWGSTSIGPQIGGVVGCVNGNVVSCTNKVDFTETIVSTTSSTDGITYHNGGIAGNMYKAETRISDCINEGILNTFSACGGILGTASAKVYVENCVNKGDISSKGEVCCDVGGIICRSWGQDLVITNCKNEGNLSIETKGRWWNGPIVAGAQNRTEFVACWIGGIFAAANINAYNCVNTGDISATGECTEYLGGIAGGSDGDIKNCYSTGNITGYSKYNNVMSSGIVGVIEGNTANGNITVENNYSTGLVLNQGRAILDAGATVAYDFVGGCFAYIHTTDNTLKYNYYVTDPIGEVLENYETPVGWYSDEEDHSDGTNFVGNSGIALSELKNGNALTNFGVYISESDLAQNSQNVWVFEEGKLPKLYWED